MLGMQASTRGLRKDISATMDEHSTVPAVSPCTLAAILPSQAIGLHEAASLQPTPAGVQALHGLCPLTCMP